MGRFSLPHKLAGDPKTLDNFRAIERRLSDPVAGIKLFNRGKVCRIRFDGSTNQLTAEVDGVVKVLADWS